MKYRDKNAAFKRFAAIHVGTSKLNQTLSMKDALEISQDIIT